MIPKNASGREQGDTASLPAGRERVIDYIRRMTAHDLAGTETGAVLDALLGSPGKLLRPRLLLLCASFGPERTEKRERLYMLAAMVELIHTASLVHDDIVDEARFRRGAPSVQSRFGKDAAVYAGDFLIARVHLWEARERFREASVLLSETIEHMCTGEIGQAALRYRTDVTAEQYLSNIRGKTASMFRAACTLGAMESGCGRPLTERLGRLGENLGIAFQLRDDLLDFLSDEEVQGKETHKDFRDGIYTLPVILALGTPEGQKKLGPMLEQNRVRPLEGAELAEMERAVRDCGGIEMATEELRRYDRESLELLDPLAGQAPAEEIRRIVYELDAV